MSKQMVSFEHGDNRYKPVYNLADDIDARFPKIRYLFWLIDNTCSVRFPKMQNALDSAYSAIEDYHQEQAATMLQLLDKAQSQLYSASEGAAAINTHLSSVVGGAMSGERCIQIMEDTVLMVNKSLVEVVQAIGEVVTLGSSICDADMTSKDAVEAELSEKEAELAAEEEQEAGLHVPRWLRMLFTCKEDVAYHAKVAKAKKRLSPAAQLKSDLAKAYEQACMAAEGRYDTLSRVGYSGYSQ